MIVTFRRPTVARTLALALAQTRRPDLIVVVDNEGSDDVEHLVTDLTRDGEPVQYVRSPENLGPAGGTALGMRHLLARAADHDWITRLDDDRTEMGPDVFEQLLRFAVEQHTANPRIGAVGAVGARYDWRTGRLRRIPDEEIATAPVPVDYVPTNVYPAYRVSAVRDVGVFDTDLFYGSSELEYGLRLRRAGYELRADPVLWRRLGRQSATTAGPRGRLRPLDWRRYYSLRNQIHVLRMNHRTSTALRVAATRGIGKPIANLPVEPSHALAHLRLNTRAILDGLRGRLGRRLDPW